MNIYPALESTITEIHADLPRLKGLPDAFKKLQDENTELKTSVTRLRKELLTLTQSTVLPIRKHEVVSHLCARYLAAIAYIGAERFNKPSHLSAHNRDLILNHSAH